MAKILVPVRSADDWKAYLAKPERHWKKGHSAWALAHCWHKAQGFPEEVIRVFQSSGIKDLERIRPLLILPEHTVSLPGGRRASQSDIWVLARSGDDLVSITVEGKVRESFGETVGRWLKDASAGKRKRLDCLMHVLGFAEQPPSGTRYQLMHRTASALIEANEFTAAHAMMMVHSLSDADDGFEDYAAFVSLFGADAQVNGITPVGQRKGVDLYLAWVRGARRWVQV
jgi:hypothetical protein